MSVQLKKKRATARLRYISIPPRKMRLVADLVKGLPIERALGILNFTPRIAAHHLAKTLKSAAANVLSLEGTDSIRPEDLFVKNIVVDEAPTAKRIRYQSMGRVFRIRKRFCHVSIWLDEQPQAKRRRIDEDTKVSSKKSPVKKKAAAKKTTAKKTTATKKAATKKTAAKKTATKKTAAAKKTKTEE